MAERRITSVLIDRAFADLPEVENHEKHPQSKHSQRDKLVEESKESQQQGQPRM